MPEGRERAARTVDAGPRRAGRGFHAALAAGLVLLSVATYARLLGHDFVTLDDGEYVVHNRGVLEGLTLEGARWAFTTFDAANWHPLTWLSHQADVELFGLAPAGHHATSLLIHAANTALLFLALAVMSGALWRPALAAALFAVHPLHVESVAWVAERKDLLCGFFWFATMLAYAGWVRQGGRRRYLAVVALFALGLLAKPMIVTLPFALVLLDVWPLGRLRSGAELALRLREKVPLCVLAAASSWVTYRAQASLGATASVGSFPLGERLANSVLAYLAYLGQSVWPAGLAVFYPHPATIGKEISLGFVVVAALVLGALSTIAVWQRLRRPWLFVGWLWFLGTLVPVIGLVQVGSQARADRYTYLPLAGLLLVAAWGAGELARRSARWRLLMVALSVAAVSVLGSAALAQSAHWRDSESLYRRALQVTESNWLAWNNLGVVLLERGDVRGALEAFRNALAIDRGYADAWFNLGLARERSGDEKAAEAAFEEGLRLDPANADGWLDLGRLLQGGGRLSAAERALGEAYRLRRDDSEAIFRLAVLRAARGDRAGVGVLVRRLRELDPDRGAELDQALARLERLRKAARTE